MTQPTHPHPVVRAPVKKAVQSATPTRRKRTVIPYWEEAKHDPVRGEKALWMAVITQAMMDALSRSSKPEEQYHKQEAIRWLTSGGKDFKSVCLLADVDPDYIRTKVRSSLKSPKPWRAEAGSGKRYDERKSYRLRMKARQALPIIPPDCAMIQLPGSYVFA